MPTSHKRHCSGAGWHVALPEKSIFNLTSINLNLFTVLSRPVYYHGTIAVIKEQESTSVFRLQTSYFT